MNTLLRHHIKHFEEFFNGSPWYGSNYTTIIGDLTDEEANWWPANGHSIHRLLLHMIKWRRALTEILLGNKEYTASVEDPDNWPKAEEIINIRWEDTKAAFELQQRIILEKLQEKSDEFLEEEFIPGRKFGWLIQGVIDHDLYHLGQIAFIRNLIRASV